MGSDRLKREGGQSKMSSRPVEAAWDRIALAPPSI